MKIPPPDTVRLLLHLGILLLALAFAFPGEAQSNAGELRLKVAGPDGIPIKASIELSSDAIQFHRAFSTDDSGQLTAFAPPAPPLMVAVIEFCWKA